jgi:serine/threonine protein kinase
MTASKFQLHKFCYNAFFIDQRYSKLKPLDTSYAFRVSAVDSISGRKVSIKKIKDLFVDSLDVQRILRDLQILKHLNGHENILAILDLMCKEDKYVDDLYIVNNLFESDLQRIIDSKQLLSTQHLQYFLYQTLRGLKYIHSANIIHRGLTPSSILVTANCDLAISDFFFARGIANSTEKNFHIDSLTAFVITGWYRAPEVLYDAPDYGKPVDIWSVGCIFAQLILQEAMFRGEYPELLLEAIVSKLGCPPKEKLNLIRHKEPLDRVLKYQFHRPPPFRTLFPPNFDKDGIDLLEKMLKFHPDDRITAEEGLKHPFLKDFHGKMLEPAAESVFEFNWKYEISEEEVIRSYLFFFVFSSQNFCLLL